MKTTCDLFCRVIDNFGDIGVCWRLARQLANEHDWSVRLWVDDLGALQGMCPALLTDLPSQTIATVDIRHWPENFPTVKPATIVIEAFACELPESYITAMACESSPPVWINLEYLTAESWATEWHGMNSPHPRLPLRKYFFFPGFDERAGGLIRERNLPLAAPAQISSPRDISLFCYETAPVADLLASLVAFGQPCRLHVAHGKAQQAVDVALAHNPSLASPTIDIIRLPFLTQAAYDALLWHCDLNFVRGEDSFIRAQWAGKPFIWHIYPQAEDAHMTKLDAFSERYLRTVDAENAAVFKMLLHSWNHQGNFKVALGNFLTRFSEQQAIALNWSNALKNQEDLASRLVSFCLSKV